MNRRDAMKLAAGAAIAGVSGVAAGSSTQDMDELPLCSRWDVYEISLQGPAAGNPFVDVTVAAEFIKGARTVHVDGFYDGDGNYKVRWMPDETGDWEWIVKSSAKEMDGKRGNMECTKGRWQDLELVEGQPLEPKREKNHGPVSVTERFHFRYADGTRFFPFGTTCYAWVFESERLQEATLANLAKYGFNKVRMCIMPKVFAAGEPERHPFPMVNGKLDFTRFDPEFFRHFEERVRDLSDLGIQADVILFHPYGKPWGYDQMPKDVNERYVRYVVARLASLHNVWWSLANEYDLLKTWTMEEWDHMFRVIQEADVSSHLRSVHHSGPMYDYAKPWCTHASLQVYDFDKVSEWKKAWGKPILFDEVMYEGNIWRRWGNLTGEEMTRRVWMVVSAGAYCTHGEVIAVKGSKDGVSADGGPMLGESPARIAFLRKIVEEMGEGLEAVDGAYYRSAMGGGGKAILYYFDFHRPENYPFPLPEGATYRAELIDPWAMTVTPVPGTFHGKSDITLSGRPYQAVRFMRI